MRTELTRVDWEQYERDGYLRLGKVLADDGCVEIIPGAHHQLINPEHNSGFLTAAQAAELLEKNECIYLELAAGEAVLLHNYLPHGSGVNSTDIPRRAFSVCYMDAATQANNGEHYSLVFGEGALTPYN